MSLYLEVKLPAQISTAEAESIISRLNSLPAVEIAYFDPVPAPLPGVDIAPPTPNFTPNQGYLQPAPQGVDANYAWAYQGGRGANVNIVDVEYAWNSAHEDLPPIFVSIGTPYLYFGDSHGTSVLGILAGDPNSFGVSGIAGEARIGVSSAYPNLPNAIFSAYSSLAPGDVILIEQQTSGPIPAGNGGGGGANGYVPVEFVQSIFDVISTATANQRVVVQAAGNGSVNLDDVAFGGMFNRLVRDSGAIIVGAGTSSARAPQAFTTLALDWTFRVGATALRPRVVAIFSIQGATRTNTTRRTSPERLAHRQLSLGHPHPFKAFSRPELAAFWPQRNFAHS